MKLKELCPHFLRAIFLLSLEEEKGVTRIFSLSYRRLKGSSSSCLSREVRRGFLLLSDAFEKRSSFLADDEVDELSSLPFH